MKIEMPGFYSFFSPLQTGQVFAWVLYTIESIAYVSILKYCELTMLGKQQLQRLENGQQETPPSFILKKPDRVNKLSRSIMSVAPI